MPEEPVRVVTMRVVAQGDPVLHLPPKDWDQGPVEDKPDREIGVDGQLVRAQVISRAALRHGDEITGPALIEQSDTTTLLAPGDKAVVDEFGNLVVRCHG